VCVVAFCTPLVFLLSLVLNFALEKKAVVEWANPRKKVGKLFSCFYAKKAYDIEYILDVFGRKNEA